MLSPDIFCYKTTGNSSLTFHVFVGFFFYFVLVCLFCLFFMSTLAVNLIMTIIDLFLISDIFRNISKLPSGLEVLS